MKQLEKVRHAAGKIKKPYQKPTFVSYGHIKEITKGGGSKPGEGGARKNKSGVG